MLGRVVDVVCRADRIAYLRCGLGWEARVDWTDHNTPPPTREKEGRERVGVGGLYGDSLAWRDLVLFQR